jgi:hypothetical protein
MCCSLAHLCWFEHVAYYQAKKIYVMGDADRFASLAGSIIRLRIVRECFDGFASMGEWPRRPCLHTASQSINGKDTFDFLLDTYTVQRVATSPWTVHMLIDLLKDLLLRLSDLSLVHDPKPGPLLD